MWYVGLSIGNYEILWVGYCKVRNTYRMCVKFCTCVNDIVDIKFLGFELDLTSALLAVTTKHNL